MDRSLDGLVPLQIALLGRISPSRYASLTRCTLYEACSAAAQPSLLPVSPAAQIGAVTHKLLEQAGKGIFRNVNRPGIEKAWDGLIAKQEGGMAQSPLLARFVPLRLTAPKYEVRRAQACTKALSIAKEASEVSRATAECHDAKTYFEKWVSSGDEVVGGVVDYLHETSSELVVRDYKTGSVFDDDSSDPQVRESYKTQLWLYAALVHETFGRWPTKLELVPLAGSPIEIEFEPDRCAELLADARRTFVKVNANIRRAIECGREEVVALAAPASGTCWYCQYRPGCVSYWRAREVTTDDGWPTDVRGVIRSARQFMDGRTLIELEPKDGEIIRVRGLSTDEGRYPGMSKLKPGLSVAIYNLRPDRLPNMFTETSLTALHLQN
jgi:PD-(D/E)XK nuclease superfamily